MSCDVGEVTESLENVALLRHRSLSNPSVDSTKSQFILQPFFRFSYVTGSSLMSLGEHPRVKWIVVMKIQPSICLDDEGKPRKKTQSGWSALEPGTSRMRVSCVTTEPPRSVIKFFVLSPFILCRIHSRIKT